MRKLLAALVLAVAVLLPIEGPTPTFAIDQKGCEGIRKAMGRAAERGDFVTYQRLSALHTRLVCGEI